MTRRLCALALMIFAACGDSDAVSTPDASTGLCAGRPCLTSIDDAADWAAVSTAHVEPRRCDFLEDSKFIAPASAAAELQEVVFQDVKAHRLHLDFMTAVLPEFFGGLTPQQYQQVVLRRAGRQYWAGALFRLVDERGATTGYGFDVAVDPAWDEQLTEAEVASVQALLVARFHLPLDYAPTSADAIYQARMFTGVVAHFPRACQYVPCATAGVDCVQVPTATAVCGHFMEGRSAAVELARKARVTVAARTIDLPRGAGNHTVPALFGPGELGPDRAAITPAAATATYQVVVQPSFVQHIYTQRYSSPAGPIELRWEVPLPEGGGGFRFAEPYLSDYFGAMLGEAAATTQDALTQLGSCTAETLERWRARGTLSDGGDFRIDYRYQPPFAGSGPLFPTRAEVTLGGQTAVVDDYFRLVYAGEHHNWNNQYWVLFAAPVTYRGHPVHGLWLDEAAFSSELDGAYTLDAARQPLDTLTVTGYVVERAP